MQKWRTLASRYVLDSPYMRVRQDTVRLPDGTVYDEYYVDERRGWVTAFCLTEDGLVVLNRQYKHGIGEVVLELPAGGVEPDDPSPESAMERELLEETGFVVDRLEHIATLIIDPTSCTGRIWVFIGHNARQIGKPSDDPKETVAVELLDPADVWAAVQDGTINVQGHVAAISIALDKLGLLDHRR